MTRRTLSPSVAALLLSSCGYINIELREVPSDGGERADAQVSAPDGRTDGGDELDARVRDSDTPVPDATASDASANDAELLPDADAQASDAQVADAQADAAADAGADAGAACDLTGSWAVKVSVPLNWSSPILEASSGEATVWLRYQGTQSGLAWTGTAQPCGFLLPDFRLNPLVAAETYGVRLPDTLFDRQPPYITAYAASMSITGSSRAGDALSIAPAAIVIGTQLTNPLTDAWPVDRTALPNRDTESDGRPGFTINYLSDATHVYPPLNVTRTQRASSSYLAVRLAFLGNGNITSCTRLDGPIAFSHFDTHILGCQVAGGSTQCDATLTDFLDGNRPNYTPNAARYEAIKVPANTTCAQIRTMLPP